MNQEPLLWKSAEEKKTIKAAFATFAEKPGAAEWLRDRIPKWISLVERWWPIRMDLEEQAKEGVFRARLLARPSGDVWRRLDPLDREAVAAGMLAAATDDVVPLASDLFPRGATGHNACIVFACKELTVPQAREYLEVLDEGFKVRPNLSLPDSLEAVLKQVTEAIGAFVEHCRLCGSTNAAGDIQPVTFGMTIERKWEQLVGAVKTGHRWIRQKGLPPLPPGEVRARGVSELPPHLQEVLELLSAVCSPSPVERRDDLAIWDDGTMTKEALEAIFPALNKPGNQQAKTVVRTDQLERIERIAAHLNGLAAKARPIEANEASQSLMFPEDPCRSLLKSLDDLRRACTRWKILDVLADTRDRLGSNWDTTDLIAALDTKVAGAAMFGAASEVHFTPARFDDAHHAFQRDFDYVRAAIDAGGADVLVHCRGHAGPARLNDLRAQLRSTKRHAEAICVALAPGSFDLRRARRELESDAEQLQQFIDELAEAKATHFASGCISPPQIDRPKSPSLHTSIVHRQAEPSCVFRRDGALWRVTYDGTTGSFTDSRGMQHIAALLARPASTISATELQHGGKAPNPGVHTFQPVLDDETREQYNDQLSDINQRIEAAEESQDDPKLVTLKQEKEAILEEMRKAVGLDGQPRSLGPKNRSEADRIAVRAALGRAYDVLDAAIPSQKSLADHLREAIRGEGVTFVYSPEPPPPPWLTS